MFGDVCVMGGSRAFAIEQLTPNQGPDDGARHRPIPEESMGSTTAVFVAEMLFADAAESETYEGGVFTHFLLEKLWEVNSADAGGVSLSALRDHVKGSVKKETRNGQEPFIRIPPPLEGCRIGPGLIE